MKRRRSVWASPRGGSALGLLACLLLLVGCPEVQTMVPVQLRGTWVAEGGGYDGRTMRIEREQITFDSGLGDVQAHGVLGVATQRLDEEIRYAIDYAMDNGGEYRLHLIQEVATGHLRLANRRQVTWVREDA